MPESRNRDIATSLGQAVKNNTITSTGSLAVVGLTAYDSAGLLPTSYDSNNAGTLGFAEDSDKLYIHTGQGWFNIAIVNTTPIFTTSPSASYELANDATGYKNGTATVITLAARDSEGFPITFSATGNSAFNNIAHVDQDSANGFIFTVEPKSQDSVGEATPASGTLTFSVTDGINIASAASTFSLTFDASIANSEETQLMLLGVGNGKNNNTVIHDAGLQNSKTVTRGGTSSELLQGSYSPYAPVGYSMYFDGSGDTASIVNTNGDFALGTPSGTTNNFTIEMWLHKTITTSGGDYDGILWWSNTDRLKFQESNSIIVFEIDDTEVTIVNETHNFMYNWSHLAIVREGTSLKTYVNGVLHTTHTNSGGPGGTNNLILGENGSNGNYGGFIKDLRIVKGTAVYTGNFTPPDGPLTTTGGSYPSTTNVNTSITAGHTKLLACTLPYLREASSSRGAIGTSGDTKMIPITPYKTSAPYDASRHGGSVFCGNGEYIQVSDHADFDLGTDDFCIEWWMNLSSYGSGTPCIFTHGWGAPADYCPFIFGLDLGDGSTRMSHFASSTSDNAFDLSDGYTTSGEGEGDDHPSLHIRLHSWYHIAFVRNGNSLKLYANGVEYASATETGSFKADAGNLVLGAAAGGSYSSAQVFFSDVRMHVGDPVYTGNFTPPTGPLTLTGGRYSDATNVNTSLTSNDTKLLFNFTNAGMIEAGGRFNFKQIGDDVTSDNGNTKWGSSVPSVHFGGSGDFLTIEDGAAGISGLSFSRFFGAAPQQDLTVDGWVYFDGAPSSQEGMFHLTTKDLDTSAISGGVAMGVNATLNQEYWRYYYAATDGNASTKASTTTWYHFAWVRGNGRMRLYIDGTEIASHTDTTDYSGRDAFNIGGYYSTSFTLDGRFSDFRYTRQSRYPFVPKKETLTTTTSFQDGITIGNSGGNVKLLAGHTSTYAGGDVNRLTDGSDTGHTIYNNGIAISTFAPIGGMSSLYFERASGTSDYFNIDAHADFLLDGDFTIEFWIFASGYAVHNAKNQRILIMDRNSGNVDDNFQILLNDTNGTIYLYAGSTLSYGSNTQNVANSTWHHVAVVRNGSSSGNLATFVDGSIDSTTTYTNSINANGRTTLRPSLGIFTGTSGGFQGYISNFRLIKGQAIYTKDFTPPSAAITG